MKRTILIVVAAALAVGSFSGCETSSSDNSPQPVRPPGSGGRGMSPGHEAQTSRGANTTR
ncbi:MAG TPA: hypothetical protein VGO90_13350 [Chthoniobacteraceae bacterium]|jgi:hypothetical protein|nr:hypothetical protein [Chthoniobacteraceae bacterium]